MIFHDMLLHNISLQSERGKNGNRCFKNQNNNFSLEKKMTVSKIYGAAVFFLSFILFLIGVFLFFRHLRDLNNTRSRVTLIIILQDM